MRRRAWVAMAAGVCALNVWLGAARIRGEDHFLTIGGGYSPTGNQISLEKNVRFFQQLLAERYPERTAHDIYFSDGGKPDRDVQYRATEDQIPRAHVLLAQVLQQTKNFFQFYRNHELENVRGGASRDNLDQWFREVGSKLTADDRLFVYVTAHGSKSSDRKDPSNTALLLWNRERLQERELATWLDRIPGEVPVVLVMVQCYSGGFANVVFAGGDADQGYTPANRCGFFATVEDRVAAGCTSDINEEDYHEYSSYFWAALRGKTRTGDSIEMPDYDHDGQVSLAEAHAYVILHSPTIDIPVKTSDAFLRQFSQLPEPPGSSADTGPAASDNQQLSPHSPYPLLLKQASSVDGAVMEGLSQLLGLDANDRAAATQGLADQLKKEKRQADARVRSLTSEQRRLAGGLANVLKREWPELENPLHPRVAAIIGGEGERLLELLESQPEFQRFEEVQRELAEASEAAFDYDRRWVKCQRLLRVLESVALENNLRLTGNDDVRQKYEHLLAAESGVLASFHQPLAE